MSRARVRSVMVRKQLYITEQQDRALKRQTGALGVSEAELVRQAPGNLLRETAGGRAPRREALDRLLLDTGRRATSHGLPAGDWFNREELYAEREGRRQGGRRPFLFFRTGR